MNLQSQAHSSTSRAWNSRGTDKPVRPKVGLSGKDAGRVNGKMRGKRDNERRGMRAIEHKPDQSRLKAVIYIQGASKDPADQDDSIAMQREVCKREADNIGATVVDEFVDAGVSGNTTNRHGLQRLLKFITENSITYVIVRDRARLARNHRDDLVIRQAIEQAGATVVSVDEGIDQAALGPLLHGVVSAFSEFASLDRRYV